MAKELPALSEAVFSQVQKVAQLEKVQKALQIAKRDVQRAMDEQVELCEIPAPTFMEEKRAQSVLERMKAYGLTDVKMDEIGNVIGVRKGTVEGGPILVLGAHMDSVFSIDTDVTVKKDGIRYSAPGIGDNCSGLRAILQVLRGLEEANIQTKGDIWFVGTVGEEGNGDIRGSKHLVKNNKIDGFIAVDSTDVGRVLYGATGSHRWRVSIDGLGGHSFAEYGKTPSAIHAMARAIEKFADLRPAADPKTTWTVGTIKGGTTVNSIAAHCEVEIDMRSFDNQCLLALEAEILSKFDEAVAEENASWTITDPERILKVTKTAIGDRPAGTRPHDCPVLQVARSAQKVLGIELTQYGRSSTDANAPMSENIPSTCLCSGGHAENAHNVKEFFEMIDTHLGPQLLTLAALSLVGVEDEEPFDAVEFALFDAARNAHKPIFGICRGMQLINVAMGGTLIEDIPNQVGNRTEHRYVTPGTPTMHEVDVLGESYLFKACAEQVITVNSFHHQAVDRVAPTLDVIARSSTDQIVEAVQANGDDFLVAVQWHPERIYQGRPENLRLVEFFIEAAQKRSYLV